MLLPNTNTSQGQMYAFRNGITRAINEGHNQNRISGLGREEELAQLMSKVPKDQWSRLEGAVCWLGFDYVWKNLRHYQEYESDEVPSSRRPGGELYKKCITKNERADD